MERLDRLGPRTALAIPAELSDAEVVRRVLGGEPALFEVLMRRYNQRVFRAIRSVLRDDHQSEDAMQQAWLDAYSHLGQYQGTASFSTWLTRIALNEALGRTGRKPRMTSIEDLREEDEAMRSRTQDPEGRAADRELGRMMEEAVDELPDLYRSVFVLREIEGMSTADAALALGASEEAVKVRFHRARLALRDGLYARVGSAAQGAFAFLGWRCDRMVASVMGRVLGGPPAAARDRGSWTAGSAAPRMTRWLAKVWRRPWVVVEDDCQGSTGALSGAGPWRATGRAGPGRRSPSRPPRS